jgi:L-alanine-DL-glutamate epimerase-like enolase superfamily enzyme
LAVLREGQPPSQFGFPNDPKTVHAVLKKLPQGTKIAVDATGSWWWFVEKARPMGQLTLSLFPVLICSTLFCGAR